MTTNRPKNLIRTAAMTTVVAGALLVPAAAAFADTPAPVDTQGTQQDGTSTGTDTGTATATDTGTGTSTDTGTQGKDGDKTQGDQANQWGEVYTVTLGNGATAQIQNRGGAYVATITVNGKEIATLSSTHPTVTDNNVTYELHPSNGHIGITYLKNTDGSDKDKDKDKKKEQGRDDTKNKDQDKSHDRSGKWGEVYTVKLGNGATARIQNRGGAYVATITVNGKEIATLSSTHPTVTDNNVTYELHPSNGHIGITYLNSRHTHHGDRTDPRQNRTAPAHRTVHTATGAVPKGGVRAGAENVHESGPSGLLMAAGGVAAASAAGLGYTFLRRNRNGA
ncbi:hypothetical protein ACFYVL_31245 [Streptomyces sp. NPDC004111]|uniref:hypothetical protein n=1 Tax=Streptomyces sp. NPDC004111 TaxID=3364690 RepID=UPI00367789C2